MDAELDFDRLDVIIFGASGFTGKHTVYEALSMLADLRWGIAGRNEDKLMSVRREVSLKSGKDLSEIPVLIADVTNESSLFRMAKRARLIVNLVGPYKLYGENVVRACLEAGTHHVDVCGEPLFMELIRLKYDEMAKERRVYVISACGFNSIPADMGTLFAEQHFHGVINSVETFLFNGLKPTARNAGKVGANYGTWVSAVHSSADKWKMSTLMDEMDAVLLPELTPELKRRSWLFFSSELKQTCLSFPSPDLAVVQRTQNLFYKSTRKRPVQIQTYVCFPTWFVAVAIAVFGLIFMLLSKFNLGRVLLLKYPSFFSAGFISREGPTDEYIKQSYFKTIIKAKGWPSSNHLKEPPKKTLWVSVTGANPAYASTSVAVLASALTVLRERKQMPGSGGVLPPGAAFAKTNLINELQKHERGMKFKIMT